VGDIESVKSSQRPTLEGGDAVDGVIDRTGGAGEVKYKVHLAHVEGLTDIFLNEVEARIVLQVFEIMAAAGEQVVDDDYVPALAEQGITEMRAEKTGAAGHQRAM
jgi:hypothetical protein